jgi:hypothetical protein
LEPAQRCVLELERRILEQAAFIRLLKRNGEAVLVAVGQDLQKDFANVTASCAETTVQAATKEKAPKR